RRCCVLRGTTRSQFRVGRRARECGNGGERRETVRTSGREEDGNQSRTNEKTKGKKKERNRHSAKKIGLKLGSQQKTKGKKLGRDDEESGDISSHDEDLMKQKEYGKKERKKWLTRGEGIETNPVTYCTKNDHCCWIRKSTILLDIEVCIFFSREWK
ncbi:hypothetical protein PRIPAC_97834, partial [Pristionchus pacificus]|uniref:Uncharacterized protein n=1 Tax=Pristionchus pacificus TaxID=54126 RepID=A0A2A6BCI3_PRIPA